MLPDEHLAALAKIRAEKGLPPKPIYPSHDRGGRGHMTAVPPASSPSNTMISYAEVADPNPIPSVMSGITQPAPESSSNTLRQVISSSRTSPTPAADVSPTGANNDLVSIDGRFYRWVNSASVSYTLSKYASTPVPSSLVDGGANGGMAGHDVRTLSESSFNKANVAHNRCQSRFYSPWTYHRHSQSICQLWQGVHYPLFIPTSRIQYSCP
jgi:hypothetical protein